MTRRLHGKVMTYDGENRPLSVTFNGKRTEYVYGADGSRLKMIQDAGTAQEKVTLYLGEVEIQNYGTGAGEVIMAYPHPDIRLTNGGSPAYFFRDQLNSVLSVWRQDGTAEAKRTYRPFGEVEEYAAPGTPEAKAYIGERFDRDAGLSYLNARYYDPELAKFIQPDWFEVTQPGVGTNGTHIALMIL